MYCKNCGKDVHPQAVACPGCGVPPLVENKFCPNCGIATQSNQTMCVKCGTALNARSAVCGTKSKVAAGLLGLFLGWLGVHKFYLGYSKEGVIMLLVSVLGGIVTCGVATGVISMIGFIEGIIYLTKSDEEFDRLYAQGHQGWF
jgi:TM2 domain-containing membrane protein YozV/RNA polymerase subunit RPABC4/transcription elongation factor Spt4